MDTERNDTNEQHPNGEDAQIEDSSSPQSSDTGHPEPIELEPDESEQTSKIHDLDVCPNCGAPLTGEDSVVCMRCGFDLRTLKSIETKHAVEEPQETIAEAEALASSRKPRLLLSYALTIISWLLLLAGYVYGLQALFPGVEPKVKTDEAGVVHEYIAIGARFLGIVKVLIITLAWSACALIGLGLFARLVERPLGRLKHALIHVVALVSVMQLARYIRFDNRSVEWTLESALQMVMFLLLSMGLLKLIRRDVITYALITILLVLCLHFGSHVLAWAAQ